MELTQVARFLLEEPVGGLIVGAVIGIIVGTICKRKLLISMEEKSGTLFWKQYMANRAKGSQFKWIVIKDFVSIVLLLTVGVVGLYMIFYWVVKIGQIL